MGSMWGEEEEEGKYQNCEIVEEGIKNRGRKIMKL